VLTAATTPAASGGPPASPLSAVVVGIAFGHHVYLFIFLGNPPVIIVHCLLALSVALRQLADTGLALAACGK